MRNTTMSTSARTFARTGALVAVAASALLATALPASASADKVTICHATGSTTNPYVVITPSASGVYHGHYRQHDDLGQGDIIPSFTYDGVTSPASKPGAELAIANGCELPTYPTYPGSSGY
jgi:hypothetical protein